MTAGAHWVIKGPSGNQGYMNETLIFIFLPSKRFIHCLEKKNIPEPEGPPCPPLGYVTDHRFEKVLVTVTATVMPMRRLHEDEVDLVHPH